MTVQSLQITILDKRVDFQLDLDPGFIADNTLLQYMAHGQVPEPEVVAAMFRILRPGDSAIDGGANIGFFSLLMSRLVGPEGRVTAVEPGSNNLPKLKANLVLNRAGNVSVLPFVLWNAERGLPFYTHRDSGLNTMAPGENGPFHSEAAMTTTLFELCAVHTPRLIKLDIEGSEMRALLSLDSTTNVIAELNIPALGRMNSSPVDVIAHMRKLGYDVFLLSDTGSFPALVPKGVTITPRKENFNVLFSTMDQVAEAWPEAVA
jgi:FkbM family methyltransferase